ncbi:MAG: alpha-glucan family phosphorylase, partial [Nanoarchaeota archaeon]
QKKSDKLIAYFSMEIGLDSRIPSYSGGLGVMAGDTIKAFADLKVPAIGITLLNEKGYFYQKLDEQGNQKELPVEWNKENFMTLLPLKIGIEIEGRPVKVQAWEYLVRSESGFDVPVFFLDTNIPGNSDYDRSLTSWLYGGDEKYRLCQEIILGIAGVRMIRALGYKEIKKYHMNEGHSSLLVVELLNDVAAENPKIKNEEELISLVRRQCVFTTHTPVPAGHDKFPLELVRQVYPNFPPEIKEHCISEDKLNMTLLALNFSHYVNGVAKKHSEVSQDMFPGYPIDSITNGVHSATWTSNEFKSLFDRHIPGWKQDSFTLRYALSIPKEEIWNAHEAAKKKLVDQVNERYNAGFDYGAFTIGFARRATSYKRAELFFKDTKKLLDIHNKVGRMQVIYGGKAHPNDAGGKEIIKRIFSIKEELRGRLNIVYLENYDMELAKLLISGVDLWLNTPLAPREASGTSGMKAMHNGVPNLSVLDGWWIEGHIENITGWSIGGSSATMTENQDDAKDAAELYEKLRKIILPMYYTDRKSWTTIMRFCIAINASFFNTHRMVQQYVMNAYFS